MDDRQPNRINQYLMPDEYVLWNGKPGKGNLLTGQDVFMIPFSIMWCGAAPESKYFRAGQYTRC